MVKPVAYWIESTDMGCEEVTARFPTQEPSSEKARDIRVKNLII